MQCIISPKNNTGKNKIKANRAGCDCSVESALQNKEGLIWYRPFPRQALFLQVVSEGAGWWRAAEAGEGESLRVLCRIQPQAGDSMVSCGVSDPCRARLPHCWTGCHCWGRAVEGMKSFHSISLFDISNYQLPAVCEVYPLFQQLGWCFPGLLQCDD